MARDTSNLDLLMDLSKSHVKKSHYASGKKIEMHNSFNAGPESNFNFLKTKHFSQTLGKQALIEAPSAPSSSKGSYFPKEISEKSRRGS